MSALEYATSRHGYRSCVALRASAMLADGRPAGHF